MYRPREFIIGLTLQHVKKNVLIALLEMSPRWRLSPLYFNTFIQLVFLSFIDIKKFECVKKKDRNCEHVV
jgi:hypothetical protein